MKKILLSLLCGTMILSMTTGCGSEPTNTGNQETNNNNKVEENTKPEENAKVDLPLTHKVSGKNIYVDAPNWQEIDKGFTKLYILHGEKYVAITAEKNNTTTDLDKAHEYAFAKFKQNIQNYSYVNSLNVTKNSKETVNGVEVYKYEGTLNCGKDTVYDAYVIGYSFIMDGVPCTITGSVVDKTQPDEMIKEVKSTVEAMIKTLRTER